MADGLAHALNYVTNNHFYVELGGSIAAAFTECTGISVQIKKEVYFEGGVNEQQRVRLGHMEFADVTLKRGITEDIGFWDWAKSSLNGGNSRRNITIMVFNQKGDVMQGWTLIGAVPVTWKVPAFQASGNAVAIEELTLAYEGLTVRQKEKGDGQDSKRDGLGYFGSS